MNLLHIVTGMVAEYVLMEWLQVLGFVHPDLPREWTEGTKGDIVLIPGFYEPWTFFRFLGRKLNQDGYRVHLVPGMKGRMGIVEAAGVVAGLLEKRGLKDVILLSHSKGGLVAKYVMDHFDSRHAIKRSVSISAPYGGTWAGYLHFFKLRELRRDSAFIRRESVIRANIGKILQLHATVDNHVLPNKNLILEGAENVQIDVVGHTRILEDERTYEAIRTRIR